jgi:pyrimidine-nucleoside phosphorylase
LSQTDEIVPADRRLYALRDATGTVEAIPLIAASIMSKKISESLTGLVLDVKRGSGSFLPRLEDELELSRAMIDLGARHGCPVIALLTAMDRPLGEACGNALEVAEAIDVLRGGGPADLIEVTMALGAEMLLLATVATTRDAAREMMQDAIASGRALIKLEELIAAQGGNARVVRDQSVLPRAPFISSFAAKRAGFVTSVEPRSIGYGIIALGGGRTSMEDTVDPSVGFVISAKPGARVVSGQRLASIHARTEEGLALGASILERAITIGDHAVSALPLVSHRVTARGVEELNAA